MSGFHVARTMGWTVYHKSPDLLGNARQLRERGLGRVLRTRKEEG
jgi:hypothetical protein